MVGHDSPAREALASAPYGQGNSSKGILRIVLLLGTEGGRSYLPLAVLVWECACGEPHGCLRRAPSASALVIMIGTHFKFSIAKPEVGFRLQFLLILRLRVPYQGVHRAPHNPWKLMM